MPVFDLVLFPNLHAFEMLNDLAVMLIVQIDYISKSLLLFKIQASNRLSNQDSHLSPS